MAEHHWYTINYVDELDSPALVVYPGRVKQNIDVLKYMINDVYRLRPHVKTFKNADAAQLMLDAGITKFKCATIAEAEMLALCHAPDVLLAYQPAGPKLHRFIELIKTSPNTRFSCLVDNNHSVLDMSASAIDHNLIINVFVDLNVGMNRTGILADEALPLYTHCFRLAGIEVMGLHAYDGFIHDADEDILSKRCNKSFEPVERLRDAIVKAGYPAPAIVAGGSPTFPVHAKRADVECSPGTFVYWDRGYELMCPQQPFLAAALVVTRVMSMPTATTLCLDCGHKSIASENELSKRIWFLNAPGLSIISHSEEHLVVEAGEGHNFKIGDVLYGQPYHICPTVALYERAITVENNNISGEWMNVARDRKINI